MNFMNAIKNELDNEKTLTWNGAVAYKTTGKKLLDFYFAITEMRYETEKEITKKFSGVYYENPLLAIKTLFQIRDCREGNGERGLFRVCMKWLANNQPRVAKAVISLIPEYGRFDDWWCLLDVNNDVREAVLANAKAVLLNDIDSMKSGKKTTIAAKWFCSENATKPETRHYAKVISEYMEMSPAQYRKTLSGLRNYIDVVERKTSSNRWGEVDYSKVPSQANLKYADAFMRHDRERRVEYLDSLKSGKTKINAKTLQPHEIVNNYVSRYYVKDYDETLEQLWKALPNVSVDNCLVVRDGSGSMTSTWGSSVRPLDVATALAIYTADHNNGIWKDKFITFSANPKFIDLSNCHTLRDKLECTYNEDDCSNTNIEKTMMLILDTAINNHLTQDEMPGTVLIISDMGFDSAMNDGYSYRNVDYKKANALFDGIANKFKAAGYLMPKMCFWNVAGESGNGIPMKENELGVVLMSGFSIQLLNMVMSNKTNPFEVLLETVNSPRYQPVEDAVKNIL